MTSNVLLDCRPWYFSLYEASQMSLLGLREYKACDKEPGATIHE